jgi:hypothetical protein
VSTNKKTQEALARCRLEYESARTELESIGFILQGSVVKRTKQCGRPECPCHTDPACEHGPYYQWTRKVKAKTVTEVLTPQQARLWQELIRNGRQLKRLVARLYAISAKAAKLMAQDDDV